MIPPRCHNSAGAAILATIGGLTTASICWRFLGIAWQYGLRPRARPYKVFADHSIAAKADNAKSWAVVTGASSGIGFEIAKLLAQDGFNVIIIARPSERLTAAKHAIEEVCNNIANFPKTQILALPFDAADARERPSAVEAWVNDNLSKLDIAVLVNNVAVHNHTPCDAHDMPVDELTRIVDINIIFTTLFTKAIAPLLINRPSQSLILNVSSLTSRSPVPYIALYAATKAFLDHWSLGLAIELESKGVTVCSMRPGITVSRMSGIETPSLMAPTAATMARAIVDHGCRSSVGGGDSVSKPPYWVHALMDSLNGVLPRCVSWPLARVVFGTKLKSV
jgi:short-subunit dehydrogenase